MFKIIETSYFERDLKYYKKKLTSQGYKELKSKLDMLYDDFGDGKFSGDTFYADEIGVNKAKKVRIGIKKMNLGQSNGMRCIYYIVKDDQEVYMITIYRKADMEPSNNELKEVVKDFIDNYF